MKISETGRSMVEMLGVLAIMGVLTVGVMLGYRYAMDRILTNSIITGVRARSVIIGQQRVLGQPLNLSEFHPDTEKDLIYGRFEVKAFNNYVYDGEESQAMEVYNIPRRVCENIRMLTFPDETITLVNGSEMGECITDGERENTGGLHTGGDYFTAEYHNVVTFIFAGLGEACSVNQDCQEGLCCVRLEEGDRGCLPCEGPTDCEPCQEWNGTTCVNKAEGARCLWTPARNGCCTAGVCGACPDRCEGNTCDRLCQTCDSATGECVNHADGTGCGECKRCENGKCVSDMTLPGCTPQCTTNTDCGACEKCENKACVPDLTLPGCTKCNADDECSDGACCCADGTCNANCCGTPCTTDTDCGTTCARCEKGVCILDMTRPGCLKGCTTSTECGTCEQCVHGVCTPDEKQPGCGPLIEECTNRDCNGVCGGGAVVDCNGVCGGGTVTDCKGVCGGTTKVDCNGVCGGGAVVDCNGVCDGGAVEDCKGACGGTAEVDCNGVCDGGAVEDCNGVCGGGAVKDCNGVCDGGAVVDCNGVCDGGAVEDCNGVCGGTAKDEGCGCGKKCCKSYSCGIVCGRECFASPVGDGENCTCGNCEAVWQAAREAAEAKDPCKSCTGECKTCKSSFDELNCSWSGGECKTDEACMCTNAGGTWI